VTVESTTAASRSTRTSSASSERAPPTRTARRDHGRQARVGRPEEGRGAREDGIHTVLDLLCTYPRRYIDRSRQADLSDLAVGDEAVILAESRPCGRAGPPEKEPRGGRRRRRRDVDDGDVLQPALAGQAARGGFQALFFGKLDVYRGTRRMVNPVVDVIVGVDGDERAATRTMRVIPVYPASSKAGLTSWELSRACRRPCGAPVRSPTHWTTSCATASASRRAPRPWSASTRPRTCRHGPCPQAAGVR